MDAPVAGVASEIDAMSDAQRVLLFDFDGVLVRGDAFSTFMRERYSRKWWRLLLLLMLPHSCCCQR
ncbi:MAG: hypothetical protein ABIO49_04725 [Dokdonella sp.]